jgi:MbtH protein
MSADSENDPTIYHVVLNDEEQYSIWPADLPVPAGWRKEGKTGPKAECLAHVKTVWTDMTPASLRRGRAGNPTP